MGIMPPKKPGQNFQWVKEIADKYQTKLEGCNFLGVFVRGYFLDSMGKPGKNDRAIYDDAFFWINVKTGAFQSYNGNADASVFRRAVANIKADQVCWYKQGLHAIGKPTQHKAFRQARNITVVRDQLGDHTGMFWTNLHRGGVNGTSSLGCLTIPPSQWDACKVFGYTEMDRAKQKQVPVILVEIK